jgi:hypothetical protein
VELEPELGAAAKPATTAAIMTLDGFFTVVVYGDFRRMHEKVLPSTCILQ